jgi:DNA-binding CsgD family transcriptional regulator
LEWEIHGEKAQDNAKLASFLVFCRIESVSMQIQVKVIILLLSLVAGAITIFVANRLMRKYPLGYLSSYFYFLVFSYIFGVYSLIGSQTINYYLSVQTIEASTILSASSILIALGIPFLVLSWYMFLRLTREVFKDQLHWIFMIAYFAISLLFFVVFILLNLNIFSGGEILFMKHPSLMPLVFSLLSLIMFGYSSGYTFARAKELTDIHQRKTLRLFSICYIVFALLIVLLVNLSGCWEWFGLAFIFMFMGFHLVPALFLTNYLTLYYVASVEKNAFSDNLDRLSDKFGITRREKEIVQLICKGMTNQQISDSLFISLQTVKDHVYRIFIKTGVKNRVQLINLLEK